LKDLSETDMKLKGPGEVFNLIFHRFQPPVCHVKLQTYGMLPYPILNIHAVNWPIMMSIIVHHD